MNNIDYMYILLLLKACVGLIRQHMVPTTTNPRTPAGDLEWGCENFSGHVMNSADGALHPLQGDPRGPHHHNWNWLLYHYILLKASLLVIAM